MKQLFAICLAAMAPVCFALYPCLRLANQSSQPIVVEPDPNWDDQILIVNGEHQHYFRYSLAYQQALQICGLWYQFGLDLYFPDQFVAVEVSNLNSELTTLSEELPSRFLNYCVSEQTSNLLSIYLIDKSSQCRTKSPIE